MEGGLVITAKALFKRHDEEFSALARAANATEAEGIMMAILYAACIIAETTKNEMGQEEFDPKVFVAQGGYKETQDADEARINLGASQ